MESHENQDQIDIREIFSLIWKFKIQIILFSLTIGVIAFFISLAFPNQYKSEIVLSESNLINANQGGNYNQVSSLARLAGLEISSSGSRVDMAVEMMKSLSFFEKFSKNYKILPALMASDFWDESTKQLFYNDDIFDVNSNSWKDSKVSRNGVPSLQIAYERFFDRVEISKDRTTNFIKITTLHKSPEVANYWATSLVKEINEVFKNEVIEKAEKSIIYLNEQIRKTNLIEVRNTLNGIIEEQFKLSMTANATDEYLFKTLSPSYAAEKKSSPDRLLIFFASIFISLILSCIFVVVYSFSTEKN